MGPEDSLAPVDLNALTTLAPAGPALTPAQAYVASLTSANSRQTVIDGLRRAARVLQQMKLDADPERWASLPWHTLSPQVLSMLRTLLAATHAPATVNVTLAALRGTARQAWRDGLLDHDGLRRLEDVANVQGERVAEGRPLSRDEQAALLRAAAAGPRLLGPRNVALLAVALGCGLRRAELLGLPHDAWPSGAWSPQATVKVMGKGNKEALVPLPRASHTALQAWWNARGADQGPLFPACDPQGRAWFGRPLRLCYLSELLAQLSERAGLAVVRPHDLRRTYGTGLLRAGIDLATVQKLMRHSRVETTTRYDLRGFDELASRVADLDVPLP